MLSRSQLQSFNRQRLDAQYGGFSCEVKVGGVTVLACKTSPTKSRQLGDGGFHVEWSFLLRVRKADLPEAPEPETFLELDGKRYIIADVADSALAGEWKIGIRQAV